MRRGTPEKCGGNRMLWYTLLLSSIELYVMQNPQMITMVMRLVAMETPVYALAVCTRPLLLLLKAWERGYPALQILHCRGNHWCVVTSIGCCAGQVKVYDSLYRSIDQVTLNLISSLFGANTQVKLEHGPKQFGVRLWCFCNCHSNAFSQWW